MPYTATSLEDIARWFDKRGNDLAIQSMHAKTHRDGYKTKAASAAWHEAANMLRETTIVAKATDDGEK